MCIARITEQTEAAKRNTSQDRGAVGQAHDGTQKD